MHYVEAVLDDATDAVVRTQWQALSAAGLPSQADHRSESNRPHVTLTVVEDWPDDPPGDLLAADPLAVPLGAPALFGRGRYTLVTQLVVTAPLLDLRTRVTTGLGPPARPFYEPGRWVPHVTLAHRLTAVQVSQALSALEALGGLGGASIDDHVTLVGLRHWDSAARRVAPLDAR